MTFVITQPCVDEQDESCVDVCPVDCIHFEDGKDRMLYISPVECIDCGACQPACPVDAIFPEAEVPAGQEHFAEINSMWYEDPEGARSRVGGAPAAAPVPAAAATVTAAAEPEAAAEDEREATPALLRFAAETQVEALPEEGADAAPATGAPVDQALTALLWFTVALVGMWIVPGPRWSLPLDVAGPSTAGVLIGIIPALLFLRVFTRNVVRAFRGPPGVSTGAAWRAVPDPWRRSEESRRHELAEIVGEIAARRFPFPSEEFAGLRTYINQPEPAMALDFRREGSDEAGEKMFPDIVVVQYPGNYPVMVAQVETSETLTAEQARRVWARMESAEAPLDVYVPSGLAHLAREYAQAAGLTHVRLRTYRRQPGGVAVREV